MTALHIHCVVPPVYVQLCNSRLSSKLSKDFFEETKITQIAPHNKSTLFSLAHMQLNILCIEVGNKIINSFMNTSKIFKGMNNKHTIQ